MQAFTIIATIIILFILVPIICLPPALSRQIVLSDCAELLIALFPFEKSHSQEGANQQPTAQHGKIDRKSICPRLLAVMGLGSTDNRVGRWVRP